MSGCNDGAVLKHRFARAVLATTVLAAGIVAMLSAPLQLQSVSAQPRIAPGNGEELRALYANAEDTAEGRRLAEASCSGCHGANGISSSAGVPHLAGQRAAYLYLELKNYQTGVRGASAMNNAVKFLSDGALLQVAAYFSSLEPPQVAGSSSAAAGVADPVESGKAAAAGCAACHGESGITKTPGMPSLVGLDPKYLAAAIKAYKNGQRKNDVMGPMAANVGDAVVDQIALYYALQKPERAQTPIAGDRTAGSTAAAACAGCHGAQGVSGNPAIPSLAGQDATYLANALQAYRQGTRGEETMKGLAGAFDGTAMRNLAAYFAAQEPKQPNVRKPLSVAEWSQRCDRCHGLNGNSADPRLPALAGQRLDYLEKVLHDYRTGARKSPQMAAMSEVLTEEDVASLAAYYAAQKPRSVVYVIVPSK